MTDRAPPQPTGLAGDLDGRRAKHLAKRHRSEVWFRAGGLAAVATAVIFVVLLLGSLITQATTALTQNDLSLKVQVTPLLADPVGSRNPQDIRMQGDFAGIVQEALLKRFPEAAENGHDEALFSLIASVAAVPLAAQIADDPSLIGRTIAVSFPVESDLDLYLKGQEGKERISKGTVAATPLKGEGNAWTIAVDGDFFARELNDFRLFLGSEAGRIERGLTIKRQRLADYQADEAAAEAALTAVAGQAEAIIASRQARLDEVSGEVSALSDEIADDVRIAQEFRVRAAAQTGEERLTDTTPSFFVELNGGVIKVTNLGASSISGIAFVEPQSASVAQAGSWQLRELRTPEAERRVKDDRIAFARVLQAEGSIKTGLNSTIFTRSDSNEPELAGILGALVGSILTLLITFVLSVPIGVLTAIYLEEFAPKNRWTDFIEVNINNLAAVPSIVFGLLGLAVFLSFFGLPRSAPLVGGLVLTLMSLPIIIIASRAALKAVPPSIREAALGVGASKVQAVFHHVLPSALPGIMTGSILGMAHALGETAPLLMIGMVAFVADVPQGFLDSATVLPVEIYMWSSRPERAWEPRTALAILALLAFMIVMNAIAVYLRRRFERRW